MSELLRISNLCTGYGEAQVLAEVGFALEEGHSLALLGRNGAGKTTLLDSIIGVTTYRSGSIRLEGREISRLRPEQRAHLGIGWVPQERNIFRSLSVEENLTAIARPGAFDLAYVYRMFPRLRERRRNLGSQLSGGEQQMLAIGRALMLNPRLLLLDEPLEGLAPIIIDELLAAMADLARNGLSLIIVEQKARKILSLTDASLVMDRGKVRWTGPSQSLMEDADLLHQLLFPENSDA